MTSLNCSFATIVTNEQSVGTGWELAGKRKVSIIMEVNIIGPIWNLCSWLLNGGEDF